MEGVSEKDAREAMRAGGGAKLPILTKFATALCPGEDAMKAAELRDLGVDELGAKERISPISCSGCVSRNRWDSSKHRTSCARSVAIWLVSDGDAAEGALVMAENWKRSASSSATRCRRASWLPSNGCAHGLYGEDRRPRRSSWCTTRRTPRRSADTVAITETRPMSRRKALALARVVRKSAEV